MIRHPPAKVCLSVPIPNIWQHLHSANVQDISLFQIISNILQLDSAVLQESDQCSIHQRFH